MKKTGSLIIIIIITLVLSGCQEENIQNNIEIDKNVNFLSNDIGLLELVNSSLEILKDDNEEITRVQLLFKFRNLLDKTIRDLSLDISYYDIDDVILFNSTFSYPNIPPNYIETDPSRPKVFEGSGVENFDHVNLRIIDYEIIE
jgi:hypothetical protein